MRALEGDKRRQAAGSRLGGRVAGRGRCDEVITWDG